MPRPDAEIVYRFSELSDEAKDNVRDRLQSHGWDRDDEFGSTLRALVKHFGGRLADYDIDWTGGTYSTVEFDMPEDEGFIPEYWTAEDDDGNLDEERLLEMKREEIKRLLDQLGEYNPETLRLAGECKLTGVYCDDDAIDAVRKAFVEGESDLDELMQAGFDALLTTAKKQFEFDYSDEGLTEDCEANDWWFDEDGNFAKPPNPGKGRFSQEDLARLERAIRLSTDPHGRCSASRCLEHELNKDVPRCRLGRKPKPQHTTSVKPAQARKSRVTRLVPRAHEDSSQMLTHQYGDQRACRRCGLDIEWHGADVGWLDRGASTYCGPYLNRAGETVWPEEGQKHRPFEGLESGD